MAFWRSRVRSASGPPFLPLVVVSVFSLAMASFALTLFTAIHRYELFDGTLVVAYGFPVPWHGRSVPAGAAFLDGKAAAFDVVFYALPLTLLLCRVPMLRTAWRAVLVAAALFAALATVGAVVAVGSEPVLRSRPPTGETVRHRTTRFHVGWDFSSR